MCNQEEKDYQDFIRKLVSKINELKDDFNRLSPDNQARVIGVIINSAETNIQLNLIRSIIENVNNL